MTASILVPIDSSPPSLAALENALAFAECIDATVEVVHVIPSPGRLTAHEGDDVDRAIDAAVARARLSLGDRISRRTLTGDPLTEILAMARDGVDLIVMGTHGRVGRLHALLGSVAEGVVRNAPCPVLTVRDPSGGYQSFAERRHGRPSVADQPRGTTAAPIAKT